jgi:hypothetical protein
MRLRGDSKGALAPRALPGNDAFSVGVEVSRAIFDCRDGDLRVCRVEEEAPVVVAVESDESHARGE